MSNDTQMHVNAAELLKSFVEAGNALEELPKVKAELAAAHELLDETNSRLSAEQSNAASLNQTIAQLRAELASKEAALAEATFRHGEAQKVIDSIRGVLPSVPTTGSDNPVPVTEPQAEAQSQVMEGQNPGRANVQSSALHALLNADVHASTTEQHDSNEAQPDPFVNPPSNGMTESSGTPPAESETSSHMNYGSNVEEAERPNRSEPTDVLEYQGQSAPERPRYQGAHYWNKPQDMSWRDFQAQGGVVPHWIQDWDAA